jgi:hypothetical protein
VLIFDDIYKTARNAAKAVAKKAVAANGLVCYVRKSTASDDVNTVRDDVGEAVDCLNPISGYTGSVGGGD